MKLLRVRAIVYLAVGIPLQFMPGAVPATRFFGISAMAIASITPFVVRRFKESSGVRSAAMADLVVAYGMWLFTPDVNALALMLVMWAVAYAVFLGSGREGRSVAVLATALQLSKLVVLSFGDGALAPLPVFVEGNRDLVLAGAGAAAIVAAYYSFALIDRHFAALNEAAATGDERYRTLMDTAPMAFVVLVDDSIVYANNAANTLFDSPEGSVVGRMFAEHIHPESRGEFEEIRAQVLTTLDPTDNHHVRLVASDGSPIWVDLSVNAVDYGIEAAIQLMLHDRSAQYRAEEQLRRSKVDYQTFFERIPVALYRTRPDGEIAHVNQALVDLVGAANKDEIIGRNARSYYVDPADRDRLNDKLSGEGVVAGYEWRIRTHDGSIRWIRDTSRLITAPTGTFYEGAMVDVTARRNIEDELWARAVQQEAAASIGQLALETEDIPFLCESLSDLVSEVLGTDGVAVMQRDEKGLFETVGASLGLMVEATMLSGIADRAHMSSAPVLLRSAAEVKFAAPALLEHGYNSCIAMMVPGKEINFGTLVVLAREERVFSSDDLNFLYSVSSVLAAAVDRARVNARLEALLKSKDAFVASVSHELRTPLTVVSGLAHELSDRWMSLSDEDMAEFTSMLVGQSEDMSDLIEDLLVAARSNIGNVSVRIVPVDASHEVHSVLAGFHSNSESAISSDVPRATIDADPIRLRQILRNLFSNASRYGGKRIEVVGFVSSGLFVIEVRDDGPPIPEGDRERIFELYERAHETAGRPGSVGLGLSVSRTLAELMNGSLTYHHYGMSTFRLELPISVPELQGGPRSGIRDDEVVGSNGTIGAGRIGIDIAAIQ